MTTKLALDHVSKSFFPYTVNERVALDDVSLTIRKRFEYNAHIHS